MVHHAVVLELGSLYYLLWGHDRIVVRAGVDPTYLLETSLLCYQINLLEVRIIQDQRIVVITLLRGFVDSFHNCPDSELVVRIFSVVTVQETRPIFEVVQPVYNKVVDVFGVHKHAVIDMTVLLHVHSDTWGHAFVADPFRVRFMVRTVFFEFVRLFMGENNGF